MIQFGHMDAERSQPNEDQQHQTPFSGHWSTPVPERSAEKGLGRRADAMFSRPVHLCASEVKMLAQMDMQAPETTTMLEQPFSSLRGLSTPEKQPLTSMANWFVRSIDAVERRIDMIDQEHSSQPMLGVTDSPAQRSVGPSEDGSTSEKNKHCSTIPSDDSLTPEQLRAYKEVEQAEMACEVKRMENLLTEERERSSSLQKLFATELMAQKEAHTNDVASLENMISKVLAENKRLSTMVEGLSGQVKASRGQLSPASSSTCPSGSTSPPSSNTSNRSKRSPVQSGSSGDDAPGRLDPKHKSNIIHRLRTLNKDHKDRAVDTSSPHPMSSEAEQGTDSDRTPSSNDVPELPRRTPKQQLYTCID